MSYNLLLVIMGKIFSCFCFSLMNICKKKISLPALHLLFLEQCGFFFLLFFFLKKIPWYLLKNKYYFYRLFFGSLGSIFWLWGLKNTSILFMVFTAFLGPFISIVASRFLLKESLGFHGYVALFFGIISGLFLSYRYNFEELPVTFLPWIVGPSATICFSLCSVFSKKLLHKASEIEIGAFLSLSAAFIYGIIFFLWSYNENFSLESLFMPYRQSWGFFYFLLLLFCHMGGNIFLLRSLKRANLVFLLPLGTFRLLFSSLLAYIFFQEIPQKSFFISLGFMMMGLWFLNKEKKEKEKIYIN